MSSDGHGVRGIEHEKWNYQATPSSHNKYSGKHDINGSYNNKMTAYCSGCQGKFHNKQKSMNNALVRHPSDAIITATGEHEYTYGSSGRGAPGTCKPGVPAEREIRTLDRSAGPSSNLTPGNNIDLVMSLTCHISHGRPFDDLLGGIIL